MAVIVESPQEILLINISASIFLNDFVFIMSRSSLLFRRIIQQKHIGGWGGGLEVVQILSGRCPCRLNLNQRVEVLS